MRKFLSSFCILILIISFFPINVLASNDDISLSQFNIQTDIKQNGDLGIKELITYDFKDNFNGAYRDISIKNTGGIRNIKVAVVLDNGKNIYFKESASAKKCNFFFSTC